MPRCSGAAEVYAANNQAVIMTPFILAGAMSPVTVAGTLTQVLAEVLAGMAFTQLVRPGAPVIFGTFVSTLSMQSGAPTFGTPEATLAIYRRRGAGAARQAAVPHRRLALRLQGAGRAGGLRERQTLLPTVPGRHQFRAARGGLDGGRARLLLREIHARLRPARRHARAGQGLRPLARTARLSRPSARSRPAAISSAAPTPRRNFETAFYRSSLSDTNSVEQWEAEGRQDAAQRANAAWKKVLAEYEAPPIDPGIDEALRDFIETKKASMPDTTH